MSKTVLFPINQFSISTQFSSIWPIDRTLAGATPPCQSGPGNVPKSSSIRLLSVMSRIFFGEGIVAFCRGAVSVFYSPSWQDNKEIRDTTKITKSQKQPKNLKNILISSTFGKKNTTLVVTKCKNKRCKICDIIIEGKSYAFKNPETRFKINKNLSCNSKNVVYIIEWNERKEIYIGSTRALNTRISLYKSNFKIEENRKLNVSKHLYQCSRGKFNIMPIYQNNDYTLLQIKERNFIDKFKP